MIYLFTLSKMEPPLNTLKIYRSVAGFSHITLFISSGTHLVCTVITYAYRFFLPFLCIHFLILTSGQARPSRGLQDE